MRASTIFSGVAWSSQSKRLSTDGATGDRFGKSVAISPDGSVVLVGAQEDDVGTNGNQGSVYIYE